MNLVGRSLTEARGLGDGVDRPLARDNAGAGRDSVSFDAIAVAQKCMEAGPRRDCFGAITR
ncbi:hypothetical protein [Limnothrix redekei]|uniref:Uncharacterized protein n=1 Tax=Limnothrix redekei LRLZ20PSL1 TaxID=3112953 RepID=A0ABW7C8S4_9CYAN